jgi:hypothetical protein
MPCFSKVRGEIMLIIYRCKIPLLRNGVLSSFKPFVISMCLEAHDNLCIVSLP